MQFNSYIFILLLMPITILLYFLANKIHVTVGKLLIIVVSILFYAYADWRTLIVLGISILINYAFAKLIKQFKMPREIFMYFPILINVCVLLYFKYFNFIALNLTGLFHMDFLPKDIILPVGISFFTFQQIAYIVAIFRYEVKTPIFIDYLTYILYFPKLLMGPLMDPSYFLDQINNQELKKVNWDNISYGVKIFSFGLFKKLMLADVFANGVSWAFANFEAATSMDWILVVLFYTFQIYFDFSGYSDMAVGTSLMLNITLPLNFDSPYKAISIRDFWKRWHISLTSFLTRYIYIPLGGSKKGNVATYVNIMIVFLISGIWHGSNWTFILWGIMHGVLMLLDRILEKVENKIFKVIRWMATFGIVNVLWLLFRSESVSQWLDILKRIFSFEKTWVSRELVNVFDIPETAFFENTFHLSQGIVGSPVFWTLIYIIFAFIICLVPENNYRKLKKNSAIMMLLAAVAFVFSFLCLSRESVFVYFNF